MRKPSVFLNILLVGLVATGTAMAQGQFNLLDIPSRMSDIANKGIITHLYSDKEQITSVGERGHILTWSDAQSWQQQIVPVSVTLTGNTRLKDGTGFAVGHESVILKSEPGTDSWVKVFDGYKLTKLKIDFIRNKIASAQDTLATLTDEDEIDELSFAIEDLEFNLEDAEIELADGPNKPLLSIESGTNNHLFAVGAYGTFLTSTDLGNTWQLVDDRVDNPDQFHLNAITRNANGDLYIVGENGMGFKSVDNGQTWQTLDLPYDGSLFGVTVKNNSVVAFGLQGNFMLSNDAGASWQAANIGSSASLLGGVIGDDLGVSLVGHSGVIVRFNVNDMANFKLHQHPSSAVFSSVLVRDNHLVLAGQFGMTTWSTK